MTFATPYCALWEWQRDGAYAGFLGGDGAHELLRDARPLLTAYGGRLLVAAHAADPSSVADAVRSLSPTPEGDPTTPAGLVALLDRLVDEQLERTARRALAPIAGRWTDLLAAASAAAPAAGRLALAVEGPLPRFLADLARHLRRRVAAQGAADLRLGRCAARLERLAVRCAAGTVAGAELGAVLADASAALSRAPLGSSVLAIP